MPAVIKYIPATDVMRNELRNVLFKEHQKRSTDYKTGLDYYYGTHDQQLIIEDDAPDDNVYKQLVKQTAERTVSFLFPNVPKIELDPQSIDETPDEAWLRKFFIKNGGLQTLIKMGLRGFLSGHVFARVVPTTNEYPKFYSLDPLSINVYWKADELSEVVWYEQRYFVSKTLFIKDFVNEGNRWVIYTYTSEVADVVTSIDIPTHHGRDFTFSTNLMTTVIDNVKLVDKEIHNYEVPPIFDCPHLPNPNSYYGLSEFSTSLKKLQDTINRVASERSASTRENFEPVDVITGADQEDVDAQGSVITIPNASAKVYRLQTKSDGAGINDQLADLINDYFVTTRVVILKGKPSDLQRVTNASLRALFLDQINKTNILRSSYGSLLADVSKVALAIGYAGNRVASNPIDTDPIVVFPEPLPMDAKEIVDTNAIAITNGFMSRRTASTRLGLSWDVELDAMESEKDMFEPDNQNVETQQVDATPTE